MSQTLYRRRAILSRIHKALDAFYMLQRIDWEYDVRATLEKIMAIALEEVEFEGDKRIERALVIVQAAGDGDLEVQGGYNVSDDADLGFSRTVVQQTISQGESILCENAKDDPRFMEAESIKDLRTLSLLSVPLRIDDRTVGAFYVESSSDGRIFDAADLEFLEEFAETTAPYIKAAITHRDHVQEIRKLHGEIQERYRLGNIIGRSEALRQAFELIRIAARVDSTVLITGESGCGKELVSRAIHHNGPRSSGKYVVVDCSSLSEHLLESELFGHRKGAFTGAADDKIGAFEEANGGTLFLDEISDASKSLQRKLRRVLQEGEIRRVGENDPRRVDVRVLCATNKDLVQLVREGKFIRDLYFRINKFPIDIPPLRQRREDIPLLVHHFLGLRARSRGEEPLGVTSDAMELLISCDWAENNIRELRNTVELACDLAESDVMDRAMVERVLAIQHTTEARSHVSRASGPSSADGDGLVRLSRDRFRSLLEEERRKGSREADPDRSETPFYRAQLEFTGRAITEGLRACGWKLRPASRLLGISPMKLRGELREFLRVTLGQHGHDPGRAAAALDMPVAVLERKLRDLHLTPPPGKSS